MILTSREKPKGLTQKEGKVFPVRSLQLNGLHPAAAQKIFQSKGSFQASEIEWERLLEHYAGNPLALKMLASPIQTLFDSSIADFLDCLERNTLIFDDIRDLLERQFNGLSKIEKEIMYWLAINRETLAFSQLQADLLTDSRPSEILEALASLQRRSLIEQSANGFM